MNTNFIKSIHIDWDRVDEYSYIRDIEALKNLDSLQFTEPVTFFVGENGSGKSTLLEAIAISSGFNPEGGTRNYNFSTYDSFSELHEAVRLSRGVRRPAWGYFLRAESFYNVATKSMDYKTEEYHEMSHGEGFLYVAQHHFQPNGLYILDEPEAALSPQRQLTLLLEIHNCVMEGSQFIVVTHSPILLGMPDSQILSFDGGTIHPCEYEDTDSYQITKMFLDNREQLLNQLLT